MKKVAPAYVLMALLSTAFQSAFAQQDPLCNSVQSCLELKNSNNNSYGELDWAILNQFLRLSNVSKNPIQQFGSYSWAVDYCAARNSRVPTAKEYATYLMGLNADGILPSAFSDYSFSLDDYYSPHPYDPRGNIYSEKSEMVGNGYEPVLAVNRQGTLNILFYFSSNNIRRVAVENYWFWFKQEQLPSAEATERLNTNNTSSFSQSFRHIKDFYANPNWYPSTRNWYTDVNHSFDNVRAVRCVRKP